MAAPRYDKEKNETRHAAASEECCDEMADKYGWSLKRAELKQPQPNQTKQVIIDDLLVDCVFEGDCKFPPSYMDLTQSDYLKEE